MTQRTTCIVCGASLPPTPRGQPRSLCGDRACREQRHRDLMAVRALAAGAQWRARTYSPREFVALVAHDRARHGELARVEWSPDDCPRRRGDDGPCIHVGCRHHACVSVTPAGGLRVNLRFERDPYSVPFTCELDQPPCDPDGATLEQVGHGFDLTREGIRQIEKKALKKLAHPSRRETIAELLELAADGHPSTGLASVQGESPAPPPGGRGVSWRELHADEPCRSVEARGDKPPMPRRRIGELPPSLAGHREDLERGRFPHGNRRGEATRAEAAEIVALAGRRE